MLAALPRDAVWALPWQPAVWRGALLSRQAAASAALTASLTSPLALSRAAALKCTAQPRSPRPPQNKGRKRRCLHINATMAFYAAGGALYHRSVVGASKPALQLDDAEAVLLA